MKEKTNEEIEFEKGAEEYIKKQTSTSTKISFDSDETIEFQIVNKFFLSKFKSKRKMLKEYERLLKRKNVKRFEPSVEEGLTSEQVQLRIDEGFANKTPNKYTKSIWAIIASNLFTYFNILMIIIAVILIAAQAPISNLFFLMIVVLNLAVGVVQEIKSKLTIDKLRLITNPKVKVIRDSKQVEINQNQVVLDDIMLLKTGDQVCVDATILQGEMEVDESALTGESLPIKKKINDYLLSGSYVISGNCICKVDKTGLDTFSADLAKNAKTYKKNTSELRRSINAFITVISLLLIPISILMAVTNYLGLGNNASINYNFFREVALTTGASVIGMIPSGLVLLVSAALCVGVVKLARKQTAVQDLYSIERLAGVSCLCLDKTGTLTDGTMNVCKVINLSSKYTIEDILPSYLKQINDDNMTSKAMKNHFGFDDKYIASKILAFSSIRKYSALTFENGNSFALGAAEYVCKDIPNEVNKLIDEQAKIGHRVLMLVNFEQLTDSGIHGKVDIVGLICLEDHIRESAYSTIEWFKQNNVKVRIISGDNPSTVSNIASKCGVENAENYISLEGKSIDEVKKIATQYTVFGRVTPDQKEAIVRSLKENGEVVAMTGDGVNDILAMKASDCSIAMNNGSDATKAIAHLVLLDSNFSNLPQVVKEGRRVINNVQLSASLFLIKTICVMLLNVSVIVLGLILNSISNLSFVYPFTPSMMLILEILIIGMPSFFLALQPNDRLVHGKFFTNVLKQAIPGGVTMFIVIFISMLLKEFVPGLKDHDSAVEVLLLNTVGLINLILLCYPFNLYRGILAAVSLILSVVFLFCLPKNLIGVDMIKELSLNELYVYISLAIFSIICMLAVRYFFKIKEKKALNKKDNK